jgi:aryl-alcohol dehydrogenase-like predicted oxidoreductase
MVGTSAASAHEIVELMWVAERRARCARQRAADVLDLHARRSSAAVLPACERFGVGAIVYGPLNGGWLTGKYDACCTPARAPARPRVLLEAVVGFRAGRDPTQVRPSRRVAITGAAGRRRAAHLALAVHARAPAA